MDFVRLEHQMNEVRKLDPDVICLQEVYDNVAKQDYRRSFQDYRSYAYDRNSSGLINRAFWKMFNLWDGPRRIMRGDQLGLLTLLSRRRGQSSIKTQRAKIFKTQAAENFSPEGLLERTKPKGYVAVDYLVDGAHIHVVNTHWSNGVKNRRRIQQAKEIVDDFLGDSKYPQSDFPVLLCGDTNADGEQREMKWLRDRVGFLDSYLAANPDLSQAPHGGMTWNAKNPLTISGHLLEPDQRIDHIYTFPGKTHRLEVVGSRIVFDQEPWVSDHFGVFSEFRVVPAHP